MKKIYLLFLLPFIIACSKSSEKIKPQFSPISESIYASGIVKSKDQYQVFPTVSGIIEKIVVAEGDTIKKGSALLYILNTAQKLITDNARLSAQFSSFSNNQEKLKEAAALMDVARSKALLDSSLFFRQQVLWKQNIGTRAELELKELNFKNSQAALFSAQLRYIDLKKQIAYLASQSEGNLALSTKQENDYIIKSEMDGMVYSLNKTEGDLVGPQTPLAVIGNAREFILSMQVDEYDILKIRKGLMVIVSLDSYKNEVFEAAVTKVYPIMNERTKTFMVEAEFVKPPKMLYPNVSFEANIVIDKKDKALLIPRNCLVNDSFVVKSNGEKVMVKTGLKDYQQIEILSGIGVNDELTVPKP